MFLDDVLDAKVYFFLGIHKRIAFSPTLRFIATDSLASDAKA